MFSILQSSAEMRSRMKIVFYGTKPYDRIWFEALQQEYGMDIHFVESSLNIETAILAKDAPGICIFVNDKADKEVIDKLYELGVRAIFLRCAGYNNVDLAAAKDKIRIMHVPGYSPEAVAEYAMGLLLSVNRNIHRAYVRTREFNMNINGLIGKDLFHKTAGVVGTGKIGQAMIRILKGFQMNVLAYDPYPSKDLDVSYVSLEELIKKSDVITLHCPLTPNTKYLINEETIKEMKDGVFLINTSRGALIDTKALLEYLKEPKKIGGVGLDVYEEEDGIFYEDKSNDIINDDTLARMMTFPNVLITSHQGYFTSEAMQAIALITLENAYQFEINGRLVHEVTI